MKMVIEKCAECDELRKVCPTCLAELAKRDYTGYQFNVKGAPYSKPIHSDAMAIHPSQVAEHREQFPGIKIDSQNRPVMENSSQHQDYMDKCGFVKRTQSTRSKGETIATLSEESEDAD